MSGRKWKYDELGNYCSVINGSTPKTGIDEYWNGNIVWITPTDLGKNKDKYISDSERKITKSGYNSSNTNIISKNNIILSTRAPIGYIAINTLDACTNQGCKGIILNDKINVDFLFHYLKFNKVELNNLGNGATFKELSTNSLLSFMIPIPSIDEQERIVNIIESKLVNTEKIKKVINEQLYLVDKLNDSYLVNILDNRKWGEIKLKDLFDLYAGGDVDRSNFSSVKTSTHLYPIYSNSLKNEGVYGYTSVPKYKGDSITITGRGALVGVPLYRGQHFDAIIRLLVLTPKDENQVSAKYFLYYISRCVDFPKESTGVPQLTIPKISDIMLPLPPIDEQHRIVKIIESKIESIDKIKNLLIEQLSDINILSSSILRKAFNGEY